MEVNEIVNRKTGSIFSQEELEFVIKEYIKEKKGVDININLSKNFTGTHFDSFINQDQMILLDKAFEVAQRYFVEKKLTL